MLPERKRIQKLAIEFFFHAVFELGQVFFLIEEPTRPSSAATPVTARFLYNYYT